MQPHRDGIGEIRLPDDDSDRTATHCVAEHDKARGCARAERPEGFACHHKRANCIIGKASHRICFYPDYTFSSQATVWPAASAASTAGRFCDNLTSLIAAAAARLAGVAAGMPSFVCVGNERENCIRVITVSESGNAIGVNA